MFKKLYQTVFDSGISFAENQIVKATGKFITTDEADRKDNAGLLALGVGGMLKTIGYVALGFTAFVAVTNPVTLAAVAGYAATAALFGSGLVFGKGLEKGGDNLTGLVTFGKDFRNGMVIAAKEDFKSWRAQKAAGPFAAAASPEAATTEAAPAVTVTAAAKPQNLK